MLTKWTFQEKRNNYLNSFLKTITEKRVYLRELNSFGNINHMVLICRKEGWWTSDNWISLTKEIYGEPKIDEPKIPEFESDFTIKLEDNNSITEFNIAKILIAYFLINYFDNKESAQLLSNIKEKMIKYFPDFYFNFSPGPGIFPTFIPTGQKTIIDNINNVDSKIADPIKELLMPMKSENELIGLISKINVHFEKTRKDSSWKSLNNIDREIAENSRKLAQNLINNVEGAKGHKGKSSLTVLDIAHNFALLASLYFKLLEMSKEKQNKVN